MLIEPIIRRFMARAPEFEQAITEHKKQYPSLNKLDTELLTSFDFEAE
jgi:hypothetical protein